MLRVKNYFVIAVLGLAACSNGADSNKGATSTTATKPTLTDVTPSPDFPDATLGMASTKAELQGKDSVRVSFAFNVKNYELKSQTSDAGTKQCNNSDKGQHIHFILDNMPYVALYEPKHEVTLPLNSEHYVMCFLSRSYHESLKNKGASVLYHFKVDDKGALVKLDTPTTPMIFYSRPKGDYLGKDTANILLDFYVANCSLGADYTVKANVKNETTGGENNFTIGQWKPRIIQNLGTGKCTVTLTLMDKNNKAMNGPNTSVSRHFQLAASEPMK